MQVLPILNHIRTQAVELPKTVPDIPETGAYLVFTGIVRNVNEGKKVAFLEYEAFPEMAEKMIREILEEAKSKWDLLYADCQHRLGKLEIGELAVVVTTGSLHRDECYASNRYIIDRVKHEVPIWKKETYTDGSTAWAVGCVHEHKKQN
ncbi:molybdopterin converting factor [Leptospira perolatii]|uniref:Molybdopterin synthase catalytic subunit n=1 Tax=Leptospira perolatii TaxID=2023191 RepID=A0A2M9ZMJ3_9LEPT|nr:molybdenum cofactor biosynthesis protein MoaE [Leptospira perolatii]PJZ70069.1 molybdopterin converting factor [Leptospira perolatii]PJZ73257.1 molybdopterin converting factor [Leptospira perolatii]